MSLLDRLRGTSRVEFDRQVLPQLDSLFATACRLTRNERDAEDLVQDTALRAFRFFHRFEAGTNIRAWLFKILHNTFITRYHRKARERELVNVLEHEEGAEPSAPRDPESEVLAGALSDDVRRALDELPEEFRTAVVLCDLEEFSYREIADIMETPVGTVMSRLHRGRRMLQESLRGYARAHGIGRQIESGEGAKVLPMRRSES